MSTATADGSLANMAASLDQWETDTLEPLARNGQDVALQEVVGMMPITILFKVFFGHQFVRRHSDLLVRLTNDADEIMKTVVNDKLACTAIYKHLNTAANRTLKRFQRDWSDLLIAYETCQERMEGEGGAFDAVVEFISSSKKEAITFNEVADTMSEIIFTNNDILSPAINWIFADLLVYPHLVDLLHLDGTREMMDRATLEKGFPELLNLITESARVHPFFPVSMSPEVLDKELELGGYLLPKGTHITIDQYSTNHNPKYWSEPNKFMPERFQTVDEFTAKWALFRFGFGARRCPGQYYANLVMANVTARLLSRWQLVPVAMESVTHHEEVALAPGPMTMLPDCRVRLKAIDAGCKSRKAAS